ncbi:MAG: phosphoesterase RecJ-like protein [Gemmatimonadales bacterium]|nr:Bifunctional oligoribonuclease and PAP phosphatase NrnA [bacterium HR33]GIW52549.1 MAG: phosphoesterase RecJ-like protein [Gemmatimonadales bacterium]
MAAPKARRPAGGVELPAPRKRAAAELAKLFKSGMRVALTTHVNADGDGLGSEVALWHILTAKGVRAVITNPTPVPEHYAFLLRGIEHADKSREAVRHLRRADAVVVLDISDLGRLGQLGEVLRERKVPVACIDHHATDGVLPDGPRLVDPEACATGELVYDLARARRWALSGDAARALYVAILTDTGGFRFSNTSPRALRIAADLLEHGLDPEEIYREVYASSSEGRVRLLAEVLETLVVEPELGLAWVTVPPGALERYGVDPEELEGVAEFPRSIKGVRLALLFRQLANGRVKISFRSVGDVDVAKLAAQFGGGGHQRASGASLVGSLAEVQATVLQVCRELLASNRSR